MGAAGGDGNRVGRTRDRKPYRCQGAVRTRDREAGSRQGKARQAIAGRQAPLHCQQKTVEAERQAIGSPTSRPPEIRREQACHVRQRGGW